MCGLLNLNCSKWHDNRWMSAWAYKNLLWLPKVANHSRLGLLNAPITGQHGGGHHRGRRIHWITETARHSKPGCIDVDAQAGR